MVALLLTRAELPIDTVSLARYLVGKVLLRELPEGVASGRRAEKRKRIPPFCEAGHTPAMPDYRRNRVPGGTFFFTVNLFDRRSNLLVARTDALRDAVRQVRARAPFHIDAWVVLPD